MVGSSRARPGSRDVAEQLHSSRGRQEEAEGGSPSLSCTQGAVRLLQGPPQQSGRRCPPHLQALAVHPESPPHLRPLWLFPSSKQEAVLPSRDSSTKQTRRYPCGEPVGTNDRLRVSPRVGVSGQRAESHRPETGEDSASSPSGGAACLVFAARRRRNQNVTVPDGPRLPTRGRGRRPSPSS